MIFMPTTSFSKMLRDLSSDYYRRAITSAEYRQRRKILLDEIDAEYNRYSLDNEDITTLRHHQQDSPASQADSGDASDKTRGNPGDRPSNDADDDTNKNWFRR